MKLFRINNWLDVVKHLLLMVTIAVIAVVFFFNIYLPVSTNHGETITVPDVIGVQYEGLDDFLESRNLRYEITKDSSYSPDYPPLSVLKQFPLPESKVKENRKIYLTLNTSSPPLVKVPDLVDASLKMAQMMLNSFDLKIGEVRYRPDLALNAVLSQEFQGKPIEPGQKLPKGSEIDLIVGDGLGNQLLEAPNLISQSEESAKIAIVGSGLKIGKISYEKTNVGVIEREVAADSIIQEKITVEPGAVFKQNPSPGRRIRLQQEIDLWIYKPDSINLNPSILDQ